MKIKVFTFLYNEELLARCLLSHYRWADSFHVFNGANQDGTDAVLVQAAEQARLGCKNVPKLVTWEPLHMPEGMNDWQKICRLNERIAEPTKEFDWYIVVDSDEFVWPVGRPDCGNVHEYLEQVWPYENVLNYYLFQAFRHVSDKDIDAEQHPVVMQRRHGDADITGWCKRKPAIFRPNCGIQFGVGCHDTLGGQAVKSERSRFGGAHWQCADPSFAVVRRIRDRRDRMSLQNYKCGFGVHCFEITPESVLQQCREHENDPQMF